MAEILRPITKGEITKVMAEMQQPYVPAVFVNKTNEYVQLHYAPKSDPNAPAHNAAHDYLKECDEATNTVTVWERGAKSQGIKWGKQRQQLMKQPEHRTIISKAGGRDAAFARVVETDRKLKKRGHSGDDKKAEGIRKKEREIDNHIWDIARQLRD